MGQRPFLREIMRTVTLTLAAIIAFAITAQAQKVSLRSSQQKTVVGTGLKVKFLSVTEDSRCPENARCIWAGVARVNVEIRKNGKPVKTFELNTNQLDKTAVYEGYEIKLTSLSPYPKDGTPIEKSKYTASFAVAKQK